MKRIALFFLLFTVLPAVADDAGSCYGIADADARAYCLAKARHDPGTCYTIFNSSLRSMCLAEVRK